MNCIMSFYELCPIDRIFLIFNLILCIFLGGLIEASFHFLRKFESKSMRGK